MCKNRQVDELVKRISAEYGAEPEFLWLEKYPSYCVFRHENNQKWFALVGRVYWRNLGVEREGEVEIINLKFDRNQAMDFAESNDGIFPAYHMNKMNWITVVLDGTVADGMVMELVRESYLLTS